MDDADGQNKGKGTKGELDPVTSDGTDVNGSNIQISIPTSHRIKILKIDSGNEHSCAIKEKPLPTLSLGSLLCWGNNHFGQSDTPSSFTLV